jgi:predicted nucleotidyltransferase
MDRLTERIAEMDRAAQARAERVRSRIALAVSLLHQKGARRIWLFGSMASGGHPHGDSDVDLVVEGLPALGLIRTLLEVEEVLGVKVDLIRLEEASDSLRARIAREGEEQHVSA